jgi:hypothetical protein
MWSTTGVSGSWAAGSEAIESVADVSVTDIVSDNGFGKSVVSSGICLALRVDGIGAKMGWLD